MSSKVQYTSASERICLSTCLSVFSFLTTGIVALLTMHGMVTSVVARGGQGRGQASSCRYNNSSGSKNCISCYTGSSVACERCTAKKPRLGSPTNLGHRTWRTEDRTPKDTIFSGTGSDRVMINTWMCILYAPQSVGHSPMRRNIIRRYTDGSLMMKEYIKLQRLQR